MLLKRRMLDSTGAVGNLFFIAPNGIGFGEVAELEAK
jgi:filamentous hemagglutinin family protein